MLIDIWGIVGQLIDNRDIFDHCPKCITINNFDWSPKSFKVNDYWFDNKDLISFVEKEWKSFVVEGRSDVVKRIR